MKPQDPQNALPGGIVLTPEAQAVLNDMLNRRLVRGAKVAKYLPIGMLVAFVAIAFFSISMALMSGQDDSERDKQDRAYEQQVQKGFDDMRAQEAKADADIDKRFGKQ